MAQQKLTKEDCIRLLREKSAELESQGEIRYPKRADFSETEVVAIKAYLGPWPRALESSGLKLPPEENRTLRNREKRMRAKRQRIASLRKLEKERRRQQDRLLKSDTPSHEESV